MSRRLPPLALFAAGGDWKPVAQTLNRQGLQRCACVWLYKLRSQRITNTLDFRIEPAHAKHGQIAILSKF